MNKMLTHPTLEERRRNNGMIKIWAQELGRARNLAEVARALSCLEQLVQTTAASYGMKLMPLRGLSSNREIEEVLFAQAKGDRALVRRRVFGRAPYDAVKDAILRYAKSHGEFSVDDALTAMPSLGVSRRSMVANLHSLANRGERPLERVQDGQMGRKGVPARYRLRR